MKRTIKNLLAATGLAFLGLGSMLASTPANAAYVAPYVPTGCALFTKTGFPYPYTPGSGQLVYCGNGDIKYRENYGGDTFLNLPFASGTSQLRQKFQAANVTMYIFKTPQDAQTALSLPASVLDPGILGITITTATSPVTTPFIAVWEKYKNSAGNLVPVPYTVTGGTTNMYQGAVSHESGHVVDFLASNASRQLYFKNSYNQDLAGFNARSTCFLFPYPTPSSANPVCSQQGVIQPNWTSKTNLQILTTINPGFTRFFTADNNGGYSELFAEQVPIVRFGNNGGIDGNLDGWILLFGTWDPNLSLVVSCTRKYTESIYKFWTTTQPAGCPN